MLVQYFAIFVVAVLLVFALIDYKKAVLFWLTAKLLFNNQIAVKYTSPGIALVIAGDALLFLVYLWKRKKVENLCDTPFLLNPILGLYLFSFSISVFLSDIPISSQVVPFVKYFLSGFCMLFLAHKVLNDKEDVVFFMRVCAAVSVLIILLAISENILGTNVWLDFVYFNSPHDFSEKRMFYLPGVMNMRYGLIRAYSFFSFQVPFGIACVCLFWLVNMYYRKNMEINAETPNKTDSFYFVVCLMLAMGVLMSNTKQAYIGFVIVLFSIYPLRTFINLKSLFLFAVIVCLVIVYAEDYLNNFYSLFDSDLAEEGGGSTVEGRHTQFEAAKLLFLRNPIFGNGIGSIAYYQSKGLFLDILGAEGSYLKILPERGLIGVVAYLSLYIYMYKKMRTHVGTKELFFYLMATFLMEFSGGEKDMSIWILPLIVISKYNSLFLETENSDYDKRKKY